MDKIVFSKSVTDILHNETRQCVRNILQAIELAYKKNDGDETFIRIRKIVLDSVNAYQRAMVDLITEIEGKLTDDDGPI